MYLALWLFTGLVAFQIMLVLVGFRFVLEFKPLGYHVLCVYLNSTVHENLHVYFGYTFFDVIRYGLTRTDGRTEFQILFTLYDTNQTNTKEINDASAS